MPCIPMRPRPWLPRLRPGGRAIAVAADVADWAAVEAMVAHTEAELGPVTILGEQRRRELAGHAGHVRQGAGRAHAPSRRGLDCGDRHGDRVTRPKMRF